MRIENRGIRTKNRGKLSFTLEKVTEIFNLPPGVSIFHIEVDPVVGICHVYIDGEEPSALTPRTGEGRVPMCTNRGYEDYLKDERTITTAEE